MNDIASSIQARREVEDRAIKLGEKRRKLDERLVANTQAIIELLDEAGSVGVPLDHVASMVGVTRQTLYRWQDVVRRKREAD